ncbi:MAG: PAC2 family protein [Actinobacteria bacterium]|nr:PAC2 family protein [Actinomycetota bacterium]
MTLFQRFSYRQLNKPILIISMDGWVDAGMAAKSALSTIMSQIDTQTIATFDTDELLDLRSRRPIARITDGVIAELDWPEIQLRAGQDGNGQDILLLIGPEPDMRWSTFCTALVGLAGELGVVLAVSLGAFPAPAPHTRPIRLASTATTQELASKIGYIQGTIEVPTGIEAALERALDAVGISAVGLWARVPHYVAAMSFPGASAALLDGLILISELVLGTPLSLDTSELHAASDATRTKVDKLIAESTEHKNMVEELELKLDSTEGNALDLGEIPSAEDIAEELERYLRDHQ